MLCYYVILNNRGPLIIDLEGTFRVETLENISQKFNIDILSKTIITREIPPKNVLKSYIRILLHPKTYNVIHNVDKPLITIIHKREIIKLPRTMIKVYCSKLSSSDNVFIFRLGVYTVKVEAYHNLIVDWKPKLKGLHAKAYNAIQEALVELGPLTVVDAVTVIAGSLRIRKDHARRILSDLIRGGFITVEGKNVLVH